MQLRPVQAEALAEIRANRAGLISAGVGHGKTLIGLLSGAALGVERVVYLCPAACVAQVTAAYHAALETWPVGEVVVLAWSRISMADGEEMLHEAAGKGTFVLVADEAHVLRSATSARAKRFAKFRRETADRSRVVLMSGTLTRKHLLDLTDVAWLALGPRSPVPVGSTAAALASYLDDPAMGRGAAEAKALCQWAGTSEVLEALGRRVRSAPGVVTTSSQSVDVPLYVVPVSRMPAAAGLQKLAAEVSATFRVPDGDDLVTPADVARVQRQLALGYHLIWTWPDGPDRQWLEARRAWAAEARKYCATTTDTELGARRHAAALVERGEDTPLTEAWLAWEPLAVDRTRWPEAKPVWHTVRVVEDMVDLADRQGKCLLWYDELAVVPLLVEMGVEVAPAGKPPLGRQRVSAVSVRSHGTGLDLQGWSRNVMLTCPPAGAAWEQVLGRTHRPGQTADEVVVWRPAWAGALNAAWRQAVEDARYIKSVFGQEQKLLGIQEVADVFQW